MAKRYAEIRRNQLIHSYGTGALVNLRDGGAIISVIMSELAVWETKSATSAITAKQKVFDSRLIKSLQSKHPQLAGLQVFRLPPIEPEKKEKNWEVDKYAYLTTNIFPKWLLCGGGCRSLRPVGEWENEQFTARRYCQTCTSGTNYEYVIPSRFVVMCENGHIEDFPYKWWLKIQNENKNDASECETRHANLKLKQRSGLGLSGLILSCEDCKAFTSMNGIFDKKMLNFKCNGKRPWLIYENQVLQECEHKMQASQRNSRSVWSSVSESSIYVPPWDDDLQIRLGEHYWSMLIKKKDDLNACETIIGIFLQEIKSECGEHFSSNELFERFKDESNLIESANIDLKVDEYKALTGQKSISSNNKNFQMRKKEIPDSSIAYIKDLKEVTRLKEVRALYAFKRMDGELIYIMNESKRLNWLPASEVFGEGFFIEFNEEYINDLFTENKFKLLLDNEDRQINKRYILLHSLSHLIMKAACVESGYSLSSIRERIYYQDGEQNGILIYTSSSDSQGTLGGLSRLTEKTRFEKILNTAMMLSNVCSNDPLCAYGSLAEDEATNHVVCHSCMLLPETTCENFNAYLSRDLVDAFFFKNHG